MAYKTTFFRGLALKTAFICMVIPACALAQEFPDKPVRIVVPYGTGGGADIFARVVGRGLEALWKQGVAIENKAGASGNIGTMDVVKARPDGYTLLLQNITMVTNYAVQGKLPYAPTTDLTPILLLGSTPHAIVAHPSAHIENLAELVAAAKKNPGSLTYASCGIGTPQHFAMEVLRRNLNLEMVNVGYKGCAPALVDVVGGQVPIAVLSANLVSAYAQSGKLKVIGVTTARRYANLPDSPTIAEQGVKSFDYDSWYALMAPGKMPTQLTRKIAADVSRVLDDVAIRKTLIEAGIEIKKGSASELGKVIVSDSQKYLGLAKKFDIKPE